MNIGDKVAIVCCSDGMPQDSRDIINKLNGTLLNIGLNPVFSDYIYRKNSVFSGSARQRASALMNFYRDKEIKAVFDISGGDIANEILPYLDYNVIRESSKLFFGYSDNTSVINAIYTKTGKASALYQIRNLIYGHGDKQVLDFKNTLIDGKDDLFRFNYEFVHKESMQGIVVGGNIRCLLKLAGTEYFPDMEGKILLLEANHGTVPHIVTYLNQLKQIGVFNKINGILLGTFSQMEKLCSVPSVVDLLKLYVGKDIPVACTGQIGHGTDSKAILIGKEICI